MYNNMLKRSLIFLSFIFIVNSAQAQMIELNPTRNWSFKAHAIYKESGIAEVVEKNVELFIQELRKDPPQNYEELEDRTAIKLQTEILKNPILVDKIRNYVIKTNLKEGVDHVTRIGAAYIVQTYADKYPKGMHVSIPQEIKERNYGACAPIDITQTDVNIHHFTFGFIILILVLAGIISKMLSIIRIYHPNFTLSDLFRFKLVLLYLIIVLVGLFALFMLFDVELNFKQLQKDKKIQELIEIERLQKKLNEKNVGYN